MREKPSKRHGKLQRRLLYVVILSALIPSLILFLFNYYIVYSNMRLLLEKDQKQEALQGASQVAFFIGEVRSILQLAAVTAIKDPDVNLQAGEYQQDSLQMLINRFDFIRVLSLYDHKGKVVASVTPKGILKYPADHDLDPEVLNDIISQGWFLGSYQQDISPLNHGTMTVPVMSGEDAVGFVQARFDLSYIYDSMSSVVGREGYLVYVIDDQGVVLGRRLNQGLQEFPWQKLQVSHEDIPVYRYTSPRGLRITSVAVPVPGTRWIMVMERPGAGHFSGPFSFFKTWLILFLAFLTLCALGAYLLIHHQLKPFEKLHEGIDAFSAGNYEFRFHIHTGDEIQDLADSFNRLAEFLEEQRRQTGFALKELKKKKREMEVSNRHMKEASRLRSEFMANMSHELRTPLNTVIGYSSIMLDGIYGEIEDKQRETLEKIYNQAFELSKLINDILDLSKMDAGKMPVFKERFRVTQVIKEILLQFRPRIMEKNLELNLEINWDQEIESDRSKVKQVLSHIISNAVKFTREGSISISCERSSSQDYIKISVVDTGIGIDRKSLGKIFDEFRQLDGSHTREYGGTGLGLSICKRILKMLSAKITVKSRKGQGSNFTIYLPLSETGEGSNLLPGRINNNAPEESKNTMEPRKIDLTRRIFLSVDGDMEFLGIIKDILEPSGYQVITTSSASEGFQLVRKYRPHVVTTDMVLPRDSARDFIRQVKSDPATFDIPLLVISTLDERTSAYSLGVSDYFIKPLDRDRFKERLETLTRMRGRRVLLVNTNREYLDLFYVILREHGLQVTTSNNGDDALSRLDREKPDLAIISHSMPWDERKSLIEKIWEQDLHREVPLMIVTRDRFTSAQKERMEDRVFTYMEHLILQREEVVPNLISIFERLWCNRDIPDINLGIEKKDPAGEDGIEKN